MNRRRRLTLGAVAVVVATVLTSMVTRHVGNAQDRGEELAVLHGCADCHSPPAGPPLSGYLLGTWLAPNITPDVVSGIGAWSREEVFAYLRRGKVPGKSQAAGPMAAIVEGLRARSDADVYAIVDWLARQPASRDSADSVPAASHGARLAAPPEATRPAAFMDTADTALSPGSLYNSACASCHGGRGAGTPDGYFPSMFRNAAVGRRAPYNLLAVMLFGVTRAVADIPVVMPSFDARSGVPGGLTDEQLAAVANFTIARFGNSSAPTIDVHDIEATRAGTWASGGSSAARGELVALGGGGAGGDGACFRCHGLDGTGDAAGAYPRLSGLDASYLAKQMRDYRSGRRPNDTMTRIAKRLDRSDDADIALYYAALGDHRREAPPAGDAHLVARGSTLYAQGAPGRGLQACARCHGVGGRGAGRTYPSIVQSAAYTSAQLRLWREGERRNDYGDVMGRVARAMNDDDIRALSAFIAALPR